MNEASLTCSSSHACYANRMKFPAFVDLSAVAAELELNGKGAQLRQMLDQAWRAQSCLGDLRQSLDCCRALRAVVKRTPGGTPQALTIERSLLATALTLYARATSTSGQQGERGSIRIEQSKVSKELWSDHEALIDVRNQAMAHVYSSRDVGSHNWHRDLFFAVEVSPGTWAPASASNQTGFHAPTLDRLERTIPAAHEIVLAKFHRRMSAVTRQVNSGGISEALLRKHQFDPVKAFGSEEGVRMVLQGRGLGTTAFWVNE